MNRKGTVSAKLNVT